MYLVLPGVADMCAFVCSGDCKACPNADLPIGERTFKDDTESSTDPCRFCTICGGVNQDGTQYELDRCSETSDTVCQDCEPCTGGTVRIGCSGTNPGSCVTMAEGVTTVLATKALTLPEGPMTEPVVMELGGSYEGVGLDIAVDTVLTWPDSRRRDILQNDTRRAGGREISASVIEPSLKMSVAASKLGFEISSCVVYFGPSGLQFDRPFTIKLSVSEKAINQLVTMQFRLAVVRWYAQEGTWKELSNAELVGSLAFVQNNHFSMYTSVAIPMERTISAAPVIVPSTTDISGPPATASSAPTGPLNQPDEPQEKPNTTSTAILLSVLGAIIALVLTAVGCWCIRHPKNLQGLPSYLTPPGMGAQPQGFDYTQASGQAAIESKILGAPDLLPGPAMVRIPAPFSAAQQTQPSLQQLGGLAAPMSSASMSIPDAQWNGGVLEPRASADLAGAGVFAPREDGLQQGKAVSQRQPVATATQPMAETRMQALSDTNLKDIDEALQARLVPFGISPASTPGALPFSLPSPAFAAAQQPRPVSARPAAPSANGVSSPQSQISVQSGRHSDTALDDLDYDSEVDRQESSWGENESSWGENESSDGESEGPALTQADLTALLAGVAAAENLSSVYIEPEASNMFAGFKQYSAGETPYTPASGATSPSARSRASNVRSNQGVPVSAAAAIEVSSSVMAP